MNNNQPGNGEEDEEDVFHDAIEDDDQAAMASPLLRNSMSRESLQSIGTMDSDVSTMSVWLQTKEGTGMPPTPDPSLTRETGAVRPLEDPLKHPLQHLVVRSSASTPSLSPPPDQSATSLQGESTTTTCSFNNDASNCLRPNSRTSPDALTTKTKGKLRAAFRNWHLVQTLGDEEFPVQGAVLTVALSPCGLYLATAGVDRVIRIYALRVRSLLKEPTSSGSSIDLVGEEMYEREPLQRLRGHLGEVLAMAWSRDAVDCLLTGGMDGTVRLWNAVKGTCLGVFPHGDGVTSLVFHPKDERLFLTGCLDCRLRLWSVEQRTVLSWNELPAGNHVTAVAFTGERLCLAGTSTGFLLFFQLSADGRAMKYNTQVHVRSQHGKNKQGRKITSVLSVPTKFGGDPRILVASNDSRVRMYRLEDKALTTKYRADGKYVNTSSQLAASVSDDGEFIVTGSESGHVVLWELQSASLRSVPFGRFLKLPSFKSRDLVTVFESVRSNPEDLSPLTTAQFAPSKVKLMSRSCGLRPSASRLDDFRHGAFLITSDFAGRVKVFENKVDS